MRNTLFGVVSSAAIGAALLATATPARADADVQYPAPANPYQGPAPGYGQVTQPAAPAYPVYPGVGPDYYNQGPPAYTTYQAPPPAPAPAAPTYQAPPPAPAPAPATYNNGGDLFVYGGGNYHPPYGKAYGPDAAPPGAYTQAGVCWLFPTETSEGTHWEEVCR